MVQTDTCSAGPVVGKRYQFNLLGFGDLTGTVRQLIRNAHGRPVQVNVERKAGGEISIPWHSILWFGEAVD